MSSAYVCVRVHCIWSTKNREEILPDEAQSRVWAYINQVGTNIGLKMLAVGGIANHVHVLIGLPANMDIAGAVQKLKANSSRFIREEFAPGFSWQESYSAFSVSVSHVDATIAYIGNQREHHKKRDFDAELQQILSECRPAEAGLACSIRRFPGTYVPGYVGKNNKRAASRPPSMLYGLVSACWLAAPASSSRWRRGPTSWWRRRSR